MSRHLPGAILLALLVSTSAFAQNPCPDGLTGACCSNAFPNIPPMPAVSWTDGRELCIVDCNAVKSQTAPLSLSAPTPVGSGCGTDFDVTLTSAGPQLCPMPGANTLRLNYTRHWQQAFPGLGNLTVYRFVATGSLCFNPPPNSCPIEPFNHAFVFGTVDYAFRQIGPPPCNLQFVAAAIAVGHSCDAFMHDPGCAQSPGTFHPFEEYVLVAPGTNFTPNLSMVPPQGPSPNLPRVGLRWIQPTSSGSCAVNESIPNVMLTNVAPFCPCLAGAPPQTPYWWQTLTLNTSCGTTVNTIPGCPFIPPSSAPPNTALTAWSIGSWGPGPFPGLPGPGNRFFLAQGSADVFSSTASLCPMPPVRTVYYGVENRWNGGQRVDLVDNGLLVPGAVFQPVVGGMPPTTGPSGTHVLFFY